MYTWFCNARAYKVPISNAMMRFKAQEIAKLLDPETKFSASIGWMDKFAKRHEISSKSLSGEGASTNQNTVDEWYKQMDEICQSYDLKDIFNIDETGLFYECKPKRSYVEQNDPRLGVKESKKRLTICLFTNSLGEKEHPIIIGNAKRPRAFGRLDVEKLYNVKWLHNKTSWMTATYFEEILKSFNKKMRLQNRKVLLFLDNATCHPALEFANVKLQFLPPNTTAACQPLDQGVIQSFKLHYRKRLMKELFDKVDGLIQNNIIDTQMEFKVSMLDAVFWISEAWKSVKPETIIKCFRKCGFASSTTTNDEQTEIVEQIEFGGGLSAADCWAFVNCDNNIGWTKEHG